MQPKSKSAPTRWARERLLYAGLHVLARQGHAGLKLASVCDHLGATTGSFYHAFPSWNAYRSDLIAYWREDQSHRLIVEAEEITDPSERLERLTQIGLTLHSDVEAAIRVWAAHDPQVQAFQADVDATRYAVIRDTYRELRDDAERADGFARIAMYLLIGYQSGTLRSDAALERGYRMVISAALSDPD